MLAEDLRTLVGHRSYEEVAGEIYRSTETVASACRGEALKPRAVVVAVAKAHGGDEEEWNHRWALAYLHLEKAGRHNLLPKRGESPDREALREAACELEVLLRAVEVKQSDQRRLALLKSEPKLAEIDQDLPTTTEKNGRNAAACWVDLTDYLRRLVLLFDHDPIPTDSRGHADLTVVLDRLSELETRTGVREWQTLAVHIRSAYELAQRNGWYPVDLTQAGFMAYGDEFAYVRAEAGRKASQLARVSAYLDAEADPAPAAEINLDRYDPPRSAYLGVAVFLALLGIAVTLVLLFVGASTYAWEAWGLIAVSIVLPIAAPAVVIGIVHARRD